MRKGDDPAAVFDALHRRRHPRSRGQPQRRDPRPASRRPRPGRLGRFDGDRWRQRIGLGDRVATRRNDPDLGVANRQTWAVAGIGEDDSLILHGRGCDREVPAEYATRFVELAYATTIHGAQGETVDHAHVALGDTAGAVAMTRGRHGNVAPLVAETLEDARKQWIAVFSRDRADLGPAHARRQAVDSIDRYGPQAATPADA